MLCKFFTTFFALVILAPQICTPSYADQAQDRALMDAVSKGDVVAVKHLLSVGRNVDAAIEGMNQPPINIAAAFDKTEVVKALIAAGAKVDTIDKYGYQPIHYAAEAGDIELVQVLLDAGAKFDAPAGNVPAQQGAQPIHLAVKSGNGALVKMLLEAGAKVDAKDSRGNSPFSYFATKDDPGSVKKILLAAGAKEEKLFVDDIKPIWLEHTEPQLRLGVWDKMMVKHNFIAKYTVNCEIGGTFVAEKTATAGDPPEAWEVLFPKDFHNTMKGLESHQAYGCGEGKHGQKFFWAIYADDVLIDSGTMIFTRKGHH